MTSRADDWSPLSLLGLLFVLAAGSELLGFEIKGLRLSGSFLSIVLAMALLGPAPAVALARRLRAGRRASSRDARSIACSSTSPRSRPSRSLGGLAIDVLVGDFDAGYGDPLWFAAAVLRASFMATNTLNFAMVAAGVPLRLRRSRSGRCCARSSPRCRRSSRPPC